MKKLIRTLSKVDIHDMSLIAEGVGSHNSKEYCKCETCGCLKSRRDSIYKSTLYYRFLRWIKSI